MQKPLSLRWGIFCLIVLSHLFYAPEKARCADTCIIGGNHVLLYKVINFWYDCLPGESGQLCGAKLQCRSTGGARVEYGGAEYRVTLCVNAGFVRLLSLWGQDGAGLRPDMLNNSWFGRGRISDLTEVPAGDPGQEICVRIRGVDRAHYRNLKGIEKDIGMDIGGSIRGLLNGKIALHGAAGFLKSCPQGAVSGERSQVSVSLFHAGTNEVLARYSIVTRNY